MWTVTFLLALAAFFTTIMSGVGKCPIWVPVVLLCILELLRHLPL